MTKVNVTAGPQTPIKAKDSLTSEALASQNEKSLESSLKKEPEVPPERMLTWRCLCGAETDRFGKDYIAHIREAKKKGESDKHKWRLVDEKTGEIVADNMRQANLIGMAATKKANPPRLTGDSDLKKEADKELDKYQPKSPLVTKFVAYTVELPSDLLVLFKLFVDRCVALDKEPPTIGEWVTQTISQFYLEHAVDFDIRGMAGEFIVKNAGGKNVGK